MPKLRYTRQVLYDQYGGVCYLCQKPLELSEMTIDHIIPRSKGGINHPSNYAPAHAFCNSVKGNLIDGYEEVVKEALQKALLKYGVEKPTKKNWGGRKAMVKRYVKAEVRKTVAMVQEEMYRQEIFKRCAESYERMREEVAPSPAHPPVLPPAQKTLIFQWFIKKLLRYPREGRGIVKDIVYLIRL